MKSKWLRFLLVLIVILLVLAFGIGGGFGKKTNNSRLNAIPLAHFAHRAGDAVLPENTAEGVAHSLALGYDGVEIDIHATSDNVFVLLHDDSCQRMLGVDGTVDQHTYAELEEQPLRNHTIPTGLHIARLDSVLSRFGDSLLFYLDIKVTGRDQADSIARLVERYAPRNVLIASSSIPFITSLEFHHPELNTVLEGFDKGEEWTWWLFPRNFRPDFLSSFDDEVDEHQIDWLREHGLLANKLVYGMDSAGYGRMRALGITRLIVDEGVPVIGR
jgi:glycerophosphoryl diester phosphodiesterase